jgi:hypothetical protein
MSMKSAMTAVLLLSATALPALAEDFATDAARPYAQVEQRPVFGGIVAARRDATRVEASNGAKSATQTDAVSGSSVPAFSLSPHAYDYLAPGHSIPSGG